MIRRLLPLVATAVVALPTLVAALPATAAGQGAATTTSARVATSQVAQRSWSTYRELRSGARAGLRLGRGHVELGTPKVRSFLGRAYEQGTWTSPWTSPGFGATAIIPSWEAITPGQSLVRVMVRARSSSGTVGSWDSVADWSMRSRHVPRTTRSGQTDDLGRVNVDTWVAASTVSAWQVRVVLLRPQGTRARVRLERVGAVASAVAPAPARTSRTGPAAGVVLPVPSFSQMVHQGHYPQWGGGGEAWCSPTSVAMVLAHYGVSQSPAGIPSGHGDAVVDHTARMVYDHGYRGTGNWAFNTAFAATRVSGDSYVTRLRSLREAEAYIAEGVPLIVSIAFRRGELTGTPISSSNGHLLVIAGFEADGDVVVNDPAGRTNAQVRRVYDRAEFERVWLNASGGTAYVIRHG